MAQSLSRKFYAVPPLLWAAIMLVLTLTPAQEMPRTPDWKLLAFDTAAHAGVFAVLAVLSWVALRQQRRWPALAQRAGIVVLIGCVLFGGLIEILQYLMAVGRQAEWSDLAGDSLGAVLALLLVGGGWHWWSRRRLATPALVLLLLLSSSLFFAPPARAQAPDLGRARRTIEALAAPKLHGRGYVQGGEHAAATYLRGRLRQLGLQPLAPDFTQPFTLDVNTFPGKMEFQLLIPTPRRLIPGSDFIASPESGAGHSPERYVAVPLDTLVFTDSTAWRQYLSPPALPNGGRPKPGPIAALVVRARDEARLAQLPPAMQQYIAQHPRFTLVPKLTASLASQQAATPHLEVLASSWPANLLTKPFTLQLDAELQHNYQTQNLAAFIRGSAQPDSFLVVSAHYDHLGMMGDKTYFPGANDNASGVALLLELAAHYARPENRPACSVVFLLFGAEEAGLVGSRYFVAHPLVPLPRIKFLVNLDLLGTGEEGATVVNGKVYEPAYQRLTALNDAHHYLPRLSARGRAANSDHFPFSEAGVPAFFLYTRGGSPAYHDVHDQPAALSLAGFAGAFGLVRDFLNDLGARP
ncbi:VanZ family protein [Hymenobacter bucti]|uniref:VanZ family protein n=1 Tax=Hymenobacter bucti TaxID=1844114 RepID=A0ABW4QR29_9BACT